MRNGNREPRNFSEQLEETGIVTRALANSAVFTGYAVGTVAAHTRPLVAAIRARLRDMAPEALLLACHAYGEGKALGLRDENFRMAERAAGKAAREVLKSAKGFFNGAMA